MVTSRKIIISNKDKLSYGGVMRWITEDYPLFVHKYGKIFIKPCPYDLEIIENKRLKELAIF